MTERLRRDFECLGIDYNAFYPGDVRLEALETLLNAPEQPAEYQVFFYHSDHLGSSSFITDIYGDATQHLQYLPFGEDLVHQQNTAAYLSPYTFSGKERDVETNLSYFGARYYESSLSIWLSVDPMSDKYPSLSAYNYCNNNPVLFIDPNGMNFEVYITGEDASETAAQLDKSTPGLNIVHDAVTGKLSATQNEGSTLTPAEAKLFEAINDKNRVVELETTRNLTYNSKDGTKNIALSPGGYEGSTVIPSNKSENAIVFGVQYLNLNAAEKMANLIGESVGETIMHEINEAYIGTVQSPGSNYEGSYNSSHYGAAALDRVKTNGIIRQELPYNVIQGGRTFTNIDYTNTRTGKTMTIQQVPR